MWLPKECLKFRERYNEKIRKQHLGEIARAISSAPDIAAKLEGNIRFKDWKRKDFVILENLSLLKKFVKNTNIEQSIINLESWIDENKVAIEERTRFLRQKSKFEIAYLYARRFYSP